MGETFLPGFAYLDIGLTILVTYLILPLALVCLGATHLYKHIKGI